MKTNHMNLKCTIQLLSLGVFILLGHTSCIKKEINLPPYKNYNVAAFVWPSCYDDEIGRIILWGEGIGEWEIIKKGVSRFDGHYQPRVPLWGHKMDDDPIAWEQKINAATDHGVNTLIFDWYWYDGKPFLEETLNEGFLGARNHSKMNFYLMWANHDVPGNMWNHYRYKTDSLIWQGKIDWDNYTIIVDRVITKYFKHPNYLKINNEPIFSIYSLPNLLKSFNDLEGVQKALDYFREEVRKAGFPGMHIQLIGRGHNGNPYLPSGKYTQVKSINEIVSLLGINSITTYNWMMGVGINNDYIQWGEDAMSLQNKWDSILTIPYFPNVTIGWDNTPRYPEKGIESVVHFNNSPESFAAYLLKAKEYADAHSEQPPLIIINAWNEWVEGSYLEPDMKWGYGYLEAVKKVMNGKYEKYQ